MVSWFNTTTTQNQTSPAYGNVEQDLGTGRLSPHPQPNSKIIQWVSRPVRRNRKESPIG